MNPKPSTPRITRIGTKVYKTLRAIVVVVLLAAVLIPVGVYVTLSTPWAQNKLRDIAQTELSTRLGTKVSIGRVDLAPFNRIALNDVAINDDFGARALTVKTLRARFELGHFLTSGRIIVDYVDIDNLDVKLYKKEDRSPLNIAKILERLKSKEPKKEPTRFDLAISTVRVSNSTFRYDILSATKPDEGHFDTKHLDVSDINLFVNLPCLSNDSISAVIEEFTARERSGLAINNLHTSVIYTPKSLFIDDLAVILPGSAFYFTDFKFEYSQPSELAKLGTSIPIDVQLLDVSHVTPADFASLVSRLANFDQSYSLQLQAQGTLNDLICNKFALASKNDAHSLRIDLTAHLQNLDSVANFAVDYAQLKLEARAQTLFDFARRADAKLPTIVAQIGNIDISASVKGTLDQAVAQINANTSAGIVTADATMQRLAANARHYNFAGDIDLERLQIGKLTGKNDLGQLSAELNFDATLAGKDLTGNVTGTVGEFQFRDIDYHDIVMHFDLEDARHFNASLAYEHELGDIDLDLHGDLTPGFEAAVVSGDIKNVNLNAMRLVKNYEGFKLSTNVKANLERDGADGIDGFVAVNNLIFDKPGEKRLAVKQINLTADAAQQLITLKSDFLNGTVDGQFHVSTLAAQCQDLASHVLPAFVNPTWHDTAENQRLQNNFTFEFQLANAENISTFIKLPVQIIYPVSIDGMLNYADHRLEFNLDAPYLQQKDKIIENTALTASLNGADERANVYFTTTMPTQKGPMALVTSLDAAQNRVDTRIDWRIERKKPINGDISFSTLLGRDDNGKLTADVDLNPGNINFGAETWHLSPAHIAWAPDNLTVDGFEMAAEPQSIKINGQATKDADSEISIDLNAVNLISIFETLDIDNALIGGQATGQFHARGLFSGQPALWCDDLHVNNIGYNYCTLGDADIVARFDNTKQSFNLDAALVDAEGRKSHIWGDIFATREALDINFDADYVKVGFLKPFMKAFAADLTGHASGRARLFGTFKDMDLEGDLFADNLGLKVDFTNTWYYATDSVHIRPGLIDLKNITLKDPYGHSALLNGWVRHDYFHFPVFDFRISDARNLLSYDTGPKQNEIWYGRIFGNGGATITGKPGVVNIGVNMTTADNSTFTFVLSDLEEADEYTFLTFRDATPVEVHDTLIAVDRLPAAVREYRDRKRAEAMKADQPSAYNMDIQVDITPQARLTVVMDPVGGDAIKANGSGNLRMTYASKGNDLQMFGSYVIERGTYNFTLQDIIVKDFTINPGSSITFTGDPYAARLDINASYAVNANLSDLDESFLNDKDLARTNVPVHAVLKASGDMRQPDINFDLDFPTLNSDIYRKVRSIVSTDEMMNRQIIYLLALNRFYTPEYMQTTKGNELFSVASSTIASQLSSMLGKLSDNWSIAPNLRSDRGDFSDIEVDVALSSHLFNNRLLLNGNLGYRDKSLNNNQFIGDLDIEYLLNRRGTWRLKAYNRFNDQNYYLRTAQTTQGLGIMFKRDFDDLFRTKSHKPKPTIPTDTKK